MPAFFDPALAETSGAGFIREGKVDEALRRLIPGAHLSKGSYSYPSRSELRDLVWNHMDQNHRPFLHRTYEDAGRLFIDRHASFSLTRFGRWPIVIPVFDGYFKENGFYQIMVLFGLIAVVNVIECTPAGEQTKIDVSWTIASHRWLRLLHPLLHRRFLKLNDVQNREDDPVRDRRIALRAAGYRFKTDEPDFVNSNVIENNTIFPPVSAQQTIATADLPDGRVVQKTVAGRELLLRRDGDAISVWPGVCPHEGAELGCSAVRGELVKCPWHGLEFRARRLAEGQQGIQICGARLSLANGSISVEGSGRVSG
jgi:nitrite reductase/ring-hydroxylating ferredoxin subunit